MQWHGRGWSAALALLALAGCGGSTSEGKVAVSATGGSIAQAGIPSGTGAQAVTFADGWTLRWTKVLVSLGHLQLKGADEAKAIDGQQNYLVDLHRGDAPLATVVGIAARRWERFSFALPTPQADAFLGDGVTTDEAQRMLEDGSTYVLEGTATKDTRTVLISWRIKLPTLDANCVNGTDGTQGIVVPADGSAQAQISIHLAHLFFTKLGSELAPLRFEPIAARADPSGEVLFDALGGQSLTQPKDAAGQPIVDEQGQPVVYDAGSTPLAENNLRGFVLASLAQAAHLNGLGACLVTRE